MAISFTTLNNGLARTTGSFLSTGSDFTVLFWAALTTPYASANRTAWVLGDDTYAVGYAWIGSSPDATAALSDNFSLETQNNVPVHSFTNNATQVATIWAHFAVTYDHTTHVSTLYMNGSSFEAATAVDLSAVTFAAERLGFDGAGAGSGIAFQYYRSFQAKLTATEIKAEMCSATAVHATPFCDTPLTGAADLADVSGNGRDWTLVGSASTYAGPVIVAGITNIDPANAVAIADFPFAYVQNVRDTTTHDVWFKYTAISSDVVIGLANFGTFPTGYVPKTAVYDGLANANADIGYLVFGGFNFNEPQQIPVFGGHTYYFKVISHAGTGSTPAVLVFTGLRAPSASSIPAGTLAITDDVDGEFGLPLALLDPLTGQPIKFVNNFPVSNNSDILADGTLLLSGSNDATDSHEYLFMYDVSLNLLYSKIAVPPLPNNGFLITSDQVGLFYVGQAFSNTVAKVTTISPTTGLPGATIWDVAITGFTIFGMAVSRDNTILYYTVGTATDNAIRRWDLVNNVALSDLTAAPAGYKTRPIIAGGACDILVLANGNIVVPFVKNNHDGLINTYTSAGALVSSVATNQLLDRLCHALDDPNSYWAWIQQVSDALIPGTFIQDGFSEYRNIKASDGSTISTTGTLIPNYEFANYLPGEDQNFLPQYVIAPTARFGASSSCPIWVMREGPFILDTLAVSCSSGLVTITGTGFSLSATVILTGPSGDLAFTVVSQTSTEIVLQLALPLANGSYCATVVNP